ncbi:MAG: holin [Patescibacteria group bacterium]
MTTKTGRNHDVYYTKKFWSYSLERMVKTFAQSAIAVLGTGSVGLLAIEWVDMFSIAGGAAFLSLLTSIVTNGRKPSGNSEE